MGSCHTNEPRAESSHAGVGAEYAAPPPAVPPPPSAAQPAAPFQPPPPASALAASASAAAPKWFSLDPRTDEKVQYTAEHEQQIEEAYQAGSLSVTLQFGSSLFTIDLRKMTQASTTGGLRSCWRVPTLTSHPQPPPLPPTDEPYGMDCSKARMLHRLRVLGTVDERVARIEAGETNPRELLRGIDTECILEVYRSIMLALQRPEVRSKYGYSGKDSSLHATLQPRRQVPQYFANISTGQSIWCRKMLSVAGLANLIIFGAEIFGELRDKTFSGCPTDYVGQVGPNKMMYYTGNSVDLETVVLRCSDPVTLKVINQQNKHQGLPQHSSVTAFGSSPQAREIAANAAGVLIERFCEQMNIAKGYERTKRRLDFDQSAARGRVPLATCNTDRGKWPLWQYVNEHVNSYHANVPNMPDVHGAILRAPWHLAHAYCTILSEFPPGAERDKWLSDFFEDAVADSCFNAKWKSIEDFCGRLAKIGSIVDKMQKLQQQYQAEFGAIYDLKDVPQEEMDRQEIALLFELCTKECPTARDRTGRIRDVTLKDCRRFVEMAASYVFEPI